MAVSVSPVVASHLPNASTPLRRPQTRERRGAAIPVRHRQSSITYSGRLESKGGTTTLETKLSGFSPQYPVFKQAPLQATKALEAHRLLFVCRHRRQLHAETGPRP